MKKEINKVIMTIGFIFVVVGLLIYGLDDELAVLTVFTYANIAAVLATAFIFAKNSVAQNVGYGLGALVGVYGISCIVNESATGVIIFSIGMILMLLAAILYFIVVALKFFGFVKGGNVTASGCNGNISDVLGRYKEMEKEKVLTAEEFDELKKKALDAVQEKAVSLDDLKKWKKMLDQQVITEEEFAAMKAKAFRN